MYDITGKVALITGGASGLGLCYAKELLRNGLRSVALADVNEDFGEIALKEISNEFGPNKAIFVKTDVSNKSAFEEAFKKTIQAFKNIDILINNAGILTDRIWEKEILINLNGTVHGMLLGMDNYIPKYKSGSEGVIVNIASIAGLDPFASVPVYTATKHAIVGLSRSYGKSDHYERTKVKVLTMCPGVTETPLVEFSNPDEKTLGPVYSKILPSELNPLTPQPVSYMAKAMIKMIKEGKTGSVWIAEDKQPAQEIKFLERHERQIRQ